MNSAETFELKEEFNKKMQKLSELLEWDFAPKSYEELKEKPDKYGFFEIKNYMKFIVKESDGFFQTFRIFAVYITLNNAVEICNVVICPNDLKFMNEHS